MAHNVLYDVIASHLTRDETTMTGSLNFELKRDWLRAELPGIEQLQYLASPLSASFAVHRSTFEMAQLASLMRHHREFFQGLTSAAEHIHTIQTETITTPSTPLTGKTLVDLHATGFRVKFGFIQSTKSLLPAVRGPAPVADGVSSGGASRSAYAISNGRRTTCRYLALVLYHTLDVAERVSLDSALKPHTRSRRKTGWTTEIGRRFTHWKHASRKSTAWTWT